MGSFLLSRRGFLKVGARALLALGLGSWLPGLRSLARASGDPLGISCVRQLITRDSSRSRMVMWHSEEPQEDALVVGKDVLSSNTVTARASSVLFSDDGVSCYVHAAVLRDLQPGREYMYQVAVGERVSAPYVLHTEGGGAFKALVFPDTQCSDRYVTWRDIAQGAAARNTDAAFFINMGDLVDNGEDHQQWADWFKAVEGMIERMPLAPLMGNHATYNREWKCRLPVCWLNYFYVPDNGSERFGRYYYSFDYGAVHFAALNNLWEELDPLRPGLMEEQVPWLREDMATSSKRWKVVLMHKDVIQYGWPDASDPLMGDIDVVGRRLMPVFEELGIDVVLTAHQHTYRRLGHILGFQPADHGPFYIDTGNAGNVLYDVPVNQRFDQKVLPQPEHGNYLTLDASDERLVFRCFLPDGSLADEAVLEKTMAQ